MAGGQESLFRSAAMSLVQLYIPAEVAHDTVEELAQLANVQFKDVSTACPLRQQDWLLLTLAYAHAHSSTPT